MSPRDLLFDLDDTLIESFPCFYRLHRQVAAELGWRVPTRHELTEYGPTWRATLTRLWPGHDVDRFIAGYNEVADDHPYPPIPGAAQALEHLHRAGHRLWIVTKRDRLRLHQRLREAELPVELFAGIYCNDDVPEPKPSPRCFEPITAALGHAPHRPVYVGDDLTDEQVSAIRGVIEKSYRVEGDLRRDVQMSVKRLMDLGCYRGLRHRRNLPVRGQRTHTNARTRKGPKRATIAQKKR